MLNNISFLKLKSGMTMHLCKYIYIEPYSTLPIAVKLLIPHSISVVMLVCSNFVYLQSNVVRQVCMYNEVELKIVCNQIMQLT